MFRIARNLLGFLGALALMLALAAGAFILGNSNPTINSAWFFAAAGITYTLIVLMVLHRS